MNQNAGYSDDRGQTNSRTDIGPPVLNIAQAAAVEQGNVTAGKSESQKACLDCRLQVVVVRLVDEKVRVKASERGIRHGKCTQSPPN